jgi:hypothetical protein
VADLADTGRKTCFVAMPVSTPPQYADQDVDHFAHVLEHLFTPALEQAGYIVIPPKILGSPLIHAEIIRYLEEADLVLADLSSHNPNVFFELGLRTSLDRPVALVKDRRTTAIPFDLGSINVLDYDDSLRPWTIEKEKKRLAEHVSHVQVGGASGNAMWNYFGRTKRGGPAEAGGLEATVGRILDEITKRQEASDRHWLRTSASQAPEAVHHFEMGANGLVAVLDDKNRTQVPAGDIRFLTWGAQDTAQNTGFTLMSNRVGAVIAMVMGTKPNVKVTHLPSMIQVDAVGRMEVVYDEVAEALGEEPGSFDQAKFEEHMSTHYGRMIHTDDRTIFDNPEDAAASDAEFVVDLVTDPGGAATEALDLDQGFTVSGHIQFPNWMTGTGNVSIYADQLGGGYDQKILSTGITMTASPTDRPALTDYAWTVTYPADRPSGSTPLSDPSPAPGSMVYRLTAVFTFDGALSDIAAFVDMGSWMIN